ncbi:AlbA family DNA-binding domain-containing protein [Streptomyces acidiscabies]|uniref:AlbA family DNA-binding domain-containing protein n=1 Tax=Streptomyces acidiscabies TaxID=42234 RepID=UPI00117E84EC|nr:ATP-binding protein [Streptomyces acidiscabies]
MAIRINEKSRALIVDGVETLPCGLVYMYDYGECAEISLLALRRAIAELEGKEIPPVKSAPDRDGPVDMSDLAEASLLEDVSNNVSFYLRDNIRPEFITIDVSNEGDLIASFFIPCEADDGRSMVEAASPHLKFQGAHLLRYRYEENPGGKIPPGWDFDILLPLRKSSLSGVRQLATVIAETIRRPPEPMGPVLTQNLCHGAPESLIGMEESDWLEVKSQGYDLDIFRDRIELAQDVSRFANSEGGGILVVGYRTKKTRHGEVIAKFTPEKEELVRANRYRSVIDARVFPLVDGLKVRTSRQEGGYVLSILVPPQAEENKPFLVHGAIVDGKMEGAFISVVRRRGEASIPITGPAIHSMLAAGRGLLRGGFHQK